MDQTKEAWGKYEKEHRFVLNNEGRVTIYRWSDLELILSHLRSHIYKDKGNTFN